MATRTLAGIYGLVAISITIWLESRGMKLESQIFLWTAVVLLGPIGIGWVTREFRQRWFWVALAASCIVHTALVWNFRNNLPARNAFASLLLGGIEAVGLAIVSAKIRDLMGHKSKQRR